MHGDIPAGLIMQMPSSRFQAFGCRRSIPDVLGTARHSEAPPVSAGVQLYSHASAVNAESGS